MITSGADPLAVTLARQEVQRLIVQAGGDPTLYQASTIEYWIHHGLPALEIVRTVLHLDIGIPTLAEVARRRSGPLPKTPIAGKIVRGLKARARKSAEDLNKQKVRRRDGYCRFPLCGCGRFQLRRDVAHGHHKGSGGNPKGDRSQPTTMLLLCAARHRENTIAVDRGTLRWVPLTKRGTSGPIAWLLARSTGPWSAPLPAWSRIMHGEPWIELARERALHVYEPFTDAQRTILDELAEMKR